jgi:glycosyltransferase involved in cell wall biosynthesis
MPEPHLPQVGCVIIVYNGEAYLAEAIDSVLSQSFTDWELVIADDGSSDASVAIAQDYARRHPDRVRTIAHSDGRNHGMSATRNLGVSVTSAPLIGFLDCDDVWLPDKLADQVEILDRFPQASMIYGRTEIWHSWLTGRGQDDFFCDLGVSPDRLIEAPLLFKLLIDNRAQTPTTCNALMRRQVWEAVGGFERQFRGMFEDQVFFAKVLLDNATYVSSTCWARYRQHGASHSAQSGSGRQTDGRHRSYLVWLFGYVMRRAPWRLDILRVIGAKIARMTWAGRKAE